MPSLIRKEKIDEKIVEPKLQETLFYSTGRVASLVHCIVAIVPISPRNPELI